MNILFREDRDLRRAMPQTLALELVEPLGRALDEIGRTLGFAQAFDPALSRVTTKVALQEYAVFKLLPKLVGCLYRQAPATKLNVRTFTARYEAVELLESGEADVAVGVPPSSAPGRIFTRALFEEAFVCILRKDDPTAGRPLDIDAFLGLEHRLDTPEGDRFGHTDTLLAERGLKRSLAITVTQMYAAPALIAGSDLIGTVIRGVIKVSGLEDRLTILPSPIPLDACPYVMVWHRHNYAHPAQNWLRECIASVA